MTTRLSIPPADLPHLPSHLDVPRLSALGPELANVEMYDRLSNFGPCLTTYDATIALIHT